MEYNETAYQNYQNNFPSAEFLQKYFGENRTILGNSHRATVATELYDGLRNLFDAVLRTSPKYFFDYQNATSTGFTSVYVFKDGQPEKWVDEQLERGGLVLALSPEAFHELGLEFMEHFRNGALMNVRDWWQWKCEDNSIWAEVVPEAIAAGKHIRRRTLSDVLTGSSPQYRA